MKLDTDDVLLLVTASRDWPDPVFLHNHLDHAFAAVLKADRNMIVMHGDCPTGGDKFADDWCKQVGCNVWPVAADWNTFGRAAGPIRNQQMVRLASMFCVAVCAAFIYNNSPGASRCAKLAESAGITTHRVRL